uniref:Uncharacterized protein n=1 Tax=Siphoviridae sp. ctYaH2 TaxID=2825549 RepID=A0A8S5V5E8_9CAUD|nr:MAG TPA: hypothetical protein [Siphoviridae sp. ctYaH2]
MILFKICLISEAQPHSYNSNSRLISSFPHFLIPKFSHFLIIPYLCTFLTY